MKKSRREFLALSGAGLLASALPGGVSAMAGPLTTDLSRFGFDLVIASYTFREFSLEDTLKMTKRLGITRIGFKSFHLPLDASDELIASTVAKCNEAGINLYGGGVIYMKTKEEVDKIRASSPAKASQKRTRSSPTTSPRRSRPSSRA